MTTEIVLAAFGLKTSDLALANELKSSEGPTMLKDSKIDGYFGVFWSPNCKYQRCF